MKVHLKIWRQQGAADKGKFVDYDMDNVVPDMSFLELLDQLNQKLVRKGEEAIAFDHDCREGICGQCGLFINGRAHGPLDNSTTCQLHMRSFEDGATIYVEPFRAGAFPIIRDLRVDRSALDRIILAGGYISFSTGNAPEANTILIGHDKAESAFDSAACIGCGACVASCKNASASLFTAAKIAHLNKLPQGKEEGDRRVLDMVAHMDEEGFGHCSNTGACHVECPQAISLEDINIMNKAFRLAKRAE